jgi:hypothetical protein
VPLPASHWRVGCACHARCFSARSNLTRLLRKIPDIKSRLLAKSLDPQDLSEGSLSVAARCQAHQQRVGLAAECLTHTEVVPVDGPNCVIVFTKRLLLTKEQSSMLGGRWAAHAADLPLRAEVGNSIGDAFSRPLGGHRPMSISGLVS